LLWISLPVTMTAAHLRMGRCGCAEEQQERHRQPEHVAMRRPCLCAASEEQTDHAPPPSAIFFQSYRGSGSIRMSVW
jgi:hypothetical protein